MNGPPHSSATIPKEVFLSHASQDAELAAQLVHALRRHGVPVWYSPTNLLGADIWHDEIGKALHRCDWFLLVLSPHAVESMWVKRELLFVDFQQPFHDACRDLLRLWGLGYQPEP